MSPLDESQLLIATACLRTIKNMISIDSEERYDIRAFTIDLLLERLHIQDSVPTKKFITGILYNIFIVLMVDINVFQRGYKNRSDHHQNQLSYHNNRYVTIQPIVLIAPYSCVTVIIVHSLAISLIVDLYELSLSKRRRRLSNNGHEPSCQIYS